MNIFTNSFTKLEIDDLERIDNDAEIIAANAQASKNWSDIDDSKKLAEKIMGVLVETKPDYRIAKAALNAVRDYLEEIPHGSRD